LQEIIMTSVVRTVLGAALLLTSASAVMAQSAPARVANQQPAQTGATTATAATNNPATANQPVQAGGTVTAAAANNAPKPNSVVTDKADPYGGHDPNSLAGTRAFWQGQNPY
jgi:outer membrane receptor protein involved in Fe transport